ncbi:MAG: DUF3343 domain-containing protein [Clostridia bacterium]|nr:DUF3343 domain-containing protein [Clostridia bacterium]
MKRYFVITGTITYAIKCRDALRRHGYKAELKRTVNSGGNVGCGYGVIAVCSLDEIKEILFMYSIRYLQIKEVED